MFNTSLNGVCSGQGLECPALGSSLLWPIITFPIRAVFILLVLYLSLAKVRWEGLKLFTVHLFVMCAIGDVVQVPWVFWTAGYLYGWIEFAPSVPVETAIQVLLLTPAIGFRLFILFFVLLSLIAYTKPVMYRTHLSDGGCYYVLIHVVSYAFTTCCACGRSVGQGTAWYMVFVHVFNITCLLVCLCTVLLTVKAALIVNTYKSTANCKQQRNRLIAFLIYTVPFNVLSIPEGVCEVLSLTSIDSSALRSVNQVVIEATLNLKTVVISICTLLALPSYRKAALQLVTCPSTVHPTTVLVVSK